MQRKPKEAKGEKAPSPVFVAMVSLFGYPGAGHFMVGKPRRGGLFALFFTVGTLGIIYEIAILLPQLYKMYQGEAWAAPQVSLPRIGFWILLTGGVWLASAADSWSAAQQYAAEFPHASALEPEQAATGISEELS